MPFPKKFAEWVARTRVTAGFVVTVVFLWMSQPSVKSCLVGGAVAFAGLGIRAWAAGHLRKNRQLAVSGPYAHVRNPLYVGTLVAGIGFGVAGTNVAIAAILVAFFMLYYLPVVEEEESHLRKILPGYDEYCRRVPRLLPSLGPRYRSGERFCWKLYLSNREYQAAIGFAVVMAALALKASS
jgi:protein-S-isoprenylcysteine O-methyltransferase Ste14